MEKKNIQQILKKWMSKNTRTRALKHANVKVQSIVIQLQDVRQERKRGRKLRKTE